MPTDADPAAQVAAHGEAERADVARLRSLGMNERARLIEAACEMAAALRASRLAASLPDVKPDPWPPSTWDSLKEHATRVQHD